MHVAVIGSGVAGMTAAYELAKLGASVEVFEALDAVGGLARSISLWGHTVDLGPHRFFSRDARVNRVWLEVVGRDYRMVNRLTRIYYKNRFFRYPLRPGNALRNLGIVSAARCIASYARERILPSTEDDSTFESWMVRRFGRRLFEIFFKPYSEKLWGIPCRAIDRDFAAQRIKRFSLGEAIKGAVALGCGSHLTLLDRFAYPLRGSGSVYEGMAALVRARGGAIHLKAPVRRVVHKGWNVNGIELGDGTVRRFDHVVSTMPVSDLVLGLGDIPEEVENAANSLTYRNTVLAYLLIEAADLFPDQWLYVHDPTLCVGRITNFRNWVPELWGDSETTVLGLEYWCSDRDLVWSLDDRALIAMAAEELRTTGLLGRARLRDGYIVRISRSYPTYRFGYRRHLERIVAYLNRFSGLAAIGRSGAFKYNNQDHSMLMGILVAQNIAAKGDHDLWEVNTDYEAYQEAWASQEEGLVTEGA